MLYFDGDAGSEDIMKQANLKNARALIAALPDDADKLFVELEEISCQHIASCFAGKSIRDLDIKNESDANIIGMKREDNSILIKPLPETYLEPTDKLFALGTRKQIKSQLNLITDDKT